MGRGKGRELKEGPWSDYMHGVGETRARAPPAQHDDRIALLEEATGLANIHGQVHPESHNLSPALLHWVLTPHREDALHRWVWQAAWGFGVTAVMKIQGQYPTAW